MPLEVHFYVEEGEVVLTGVAIYFHDILDTLLARDKRAVEGIRAECKARWEEVYG